MAKGSVKTFLKKRVVFMRGPIGSAVAMNVIRSLAEIKATASGKTAYLIIDSTGGDFYASMKIFHALQSCALGVVTVAFGSAGSGALIVLQGGDVRLATAKSLLRFHNTRHFV